MDYSVVVAAYKNSFNLINRIKEIEKSSLLPIDVTVIINYFDEKNFNECIDYCKTTKTVTRYVACSQNIGIAYAWNLGMKISAGKVVVILNDDCSIGIKTLEDIIEPFNSYRVGVVGVKAGGKYGDTAVTPQGFLIAFRKAMLEEVGYYDEVASPLACERELSLRSKVYGWDIRIISTEWRHIHDISNNPNTKINFLGNIWIPSRDQIYTEAQLDKKIENHNFWLDSAKH